MRAVQALTLALLAALALCVTAGAVLGQRAGGPSTLQVDYYYIPYCIACARVNEGLDGLEAELGARVRIRRVDCFSPEGLKAAARYGFVTHGLVVHDSRRGLVFEQKDHGVRAEDVRAVLHAELSR